MKEYEPRDAGLYGCFLLLAVDVLTDKRFVGLKVHVQYRHSPDRGIGVASLDRYAALYNVIAQKAERLQAEFPAFRFSQIGGQVRQEAVHQTHGVG